MKHIVYFHHMKEAFGYYNRNNAISLISDYEQERIVAFHRDQDKGTAIIGKLLLQIGLQNLGYTSEYLKQLKYTEQKRPYLEIPWDFNITHCDDLVAIVFAENMHAGIDVEKIAPLDIIDFQNCFTVTEWNDILSSPNQYSCFYHYWTRKEAVLKAIGSGLLIHPSLFSAIEDHVSWEQTEWYLHKIEIDTDHMCHLATNDKNPEIRIQEISDPFEFI